MMALPPPSVPHRPSPRHAGVGVLAAACGLGLLPSSAHAAGPFSQGSMTMTMALTGLGVLALVAGGLALAACRRRQSRNRDSLKGAATGGESRRLLDVLARIQGHYIARPSEPAGFEGLLQDILAMTESPYGVLRMNVADKKDIVVPPQTAVAWRDGLSIAQMEKTVLTDLDTPLAQALKSNRPQVGADVVDGVTVTYCALALVVGDRQVGALALANRHEGYPDTLLEYWLPVFNATAQILYALQQRRAREAAQQAALQTAEQHRMVLENMADGILILDADLIVRQINPATETLFGYTAERIIGQDGARLFAVQPAGGDDGFDKAAFAKRQSRFLNGGAETQGLHESGRIFPVELTVTPIIGDHDAAYVATIHDLTRQKTDAAALARSEHETRSILDNMADTFYRTDLEGRVVMVSRAVTSLLGYTQTELLGTRLADLYERAEDRNVFLKAMADNNGQVTDFRAPLIHRNGNMVWVSTNARYWRDADGTVKGVEGTTRDITERLVAERALAESERRFRAIVDHTFEWENWIDPDGKVVWVSSGVERVIGYAAAECLAMDGYPRALVHPDDRDAFDRALTQPEGSAREFRFLHRDGREVWGAMSWLAIADQNGADLGIRTSIRDITEAKAVETHFVQQAKLATLGETAAGLVHELSQPLNIIRLAAEGTLLKMDDTPLSPSEQHHQFSLIEGQARRMGEIIDHIRVFSRKDQDAVEYFNPLDAVTASVDLLTDQLRADGIDVIHDLPDVPCAIKGRQVQLEQVILNLLTNARDAIMERRTLHPDDPRADAVTVTGALREQGTRLHLSVDDTGLGFPPDHLDRAFEPFFTTKDVGLGTGLGLSVSFGIITGLSGRISATNTDEGARIDIELPCEQPTPTPQAPAKSSGGILPDAGQRHALVVDDEQEAAFAIATFVEGLGFRVSVSHDGEEAKEIFAADPADVVITDIRMPRCDGHSLIQSLRTEAPGLPVIAITGHFGNGNANDDAQRASPDYLLRKPVSLTDLRDALRELLQRIGPKDADAP